MDNLSRRLLEKVDIKNIPNFSSLKEITSYLDGVTDSNMLIPNTTSESLTITLGYQGSGGDLSGYQLEIQGLGDDIDEDSRSRKANILDRVIKGKQQVQEETGHTVNDDEYMNQIVKNIVNNTDSDRIFASTLPVIKTEYLRKRVPVIYSELEKLTMQKKTMNGNDRVTFGVYYSDILKKFIMVYNPDFLIEMAIKEYLYRFDSYPDFKGCFIYCFLFVISHEIMHILRHHTHNRMNVLQDVEPNIVNIFGDAFINMNLSRKLFDSKLVKKPTAPAIGISNENIFKGTLRDDVKGKDFSDIRNMMLNILGKYTGVKFSPISNASGKLEVSEPKFVMKIVYPEKSVISVFRDNSSNFIKCMNEIFNYLSDKIEQVNNKPAEMKIGSPVRVRATDDRGVIVDMTKDGKFKVAGSSGAENDDLNTLSDYEQGNDVTILGDFTKEELKPIVTQDVGGQELESGGDESDSGDLEDDDYDVENHGKSDVKDTGDSDDNKPQSTEKTLSVGSTVKVKGTGQVGVITKLNGDGSFDVGEVVIYQNESNQEFLNLMEYYKKTGSKLGTFNSSELVPYDIDSPSGNNNSDSESDDGENDSEGESKEDDNGDSAGNPEDSDMGSSSPPDGDGGQDSDSNASPDDEFEGGGGSENTNPTNDKSAIDSLLDDLETSKDTTNVSKEEEEKSHRGIENNLSKSKKKDLADRLKRDLESTLHSVKDNLSDDDRKLLGSIGANRIVKIPNVSITDWQRSLHKMLRNALGIKHTYNPRRANRRVEGAFGAKEIKPDIKSIIIMLDCSMSMGAPQFKESLRHIQTFADQLKSKPRFTIICWGTGNREEQAKNIYTTRKKSELVKLIMSKGKQRSWMTNINPAFEYAQERVWGKPDGIIILTDGQLNGPQPDNRILKYTSKYRKKIVWVLTSNGSLTYGIKDYDPTARLGDRVIKQKKNR